MLQPIPAHTCFVERHIQKIDITVWYANKSACSFGFSSPYQPFYLQYFSSVYLPRLLALKKLSHIFIQGRHVLHLVVMTTY